MMNKKKNRYNRIASDDWKKLSKDEKSKLSKKIYREEHKRIDIYFTLEEYEKITRYSEISGLPVRTYVRKRSLQEPDRKLFYPAINAQAVSQFRKIGVNINQMTKQINSAPTEINTLKIMDELNQMKKLLQTLIEKYGL
ncbi:MAG: plasmid mobilization protein [Cyclobacteriaceae bacterium]